MFSKKLWLLKQNDDEILYQVFGSENAKSEAELKDYLQLDVNVSDLYEMWKKVDPVFSKTVGNKFHGIRVLRQDPVESLFSFIISSNNNIERISSLVEKLCVHYGDKIATLGEKTFYTFPSVQTLAAEGVGEKLKELGFGYRADYISKTAQYINSEEVGENWLYSLRSEPYEDAKKQLQEKLKGVGPKVADCVCLMSLDKPGAIPVDTHIQQIVCRDYLPSLKDKQSLTAKRYDEIGNYFRNLWGTYAGWAQAILFAAELRRFKKNDPGLKKTKKEIPTSPEKKRKKTKKKETN